jgi:hypothetical protein
MKKQAFALAVGLMCAGATAVAHLDSAIADDKSASSEAIVAPTPYVPGSGDTVTSHTDGPFTPADSGTVTMGAYPSEDRLYEGGRADDVPSVKSGSETIGRVPAADEAAGGRHQHQLGEDAN